MGDADRHAWKRASVERRPTHEPVVVNVPGMDKRFALHVDGTAYELRDSGHRRVRDRALLAKLREVVANA